MEVHVCIIRNNNLEVHGHEFAVLHNDCAVDDGEVHKAKGRSAEDQGSHRVWAGPAEP